MGLFTDTIDTVSASLTALGLKPVTDPRNARPLTVFIELPVFTNWTSKVADVTITLRVLGAPPGNSDSTNYILNVVDTIVDSEIAVINGQPSIASIGSQDLPCYDLTIKISAAR